MHISKIALLCFCFFLSGCGIVSQQNGNNTVGSLSGGSVYAPLSFVDEQGIQMTSYNNTTYEASKWTQTGNKTDLTLLSSYYGLPLAGIGTNCFSGTGLTSINLPDSITSIGANSFSKTALANIAIPKLISSIKGEAFLGCPRLEEITIPKSVITIEAWAFDQDKIKTIHYGGSKDDWSKISIGTKNDGLTTATIIYGE
jgi:hypothetical protein